MSYRQDLRDAELAVIRAAEDAACGPTAPGAVLDTENCKTTMDLRVAVEALQALRANLDAPIAPSSDDDTSANAARMALPMVGGLRRKIVFDISRRMKHPVPGATVDQLCRGLDRKHQSVSSAVNFLRDVGWLRDSGVRLTTSSGTPAIVWVLTDFGRGQVVSLALKAATKAFEGVARGTTETSGQ